MTRPLLKIVKAGPQTSIQDLGRPGLLHTGMPQSGAQDFWALKVANELVGNSVGGSFGTQDGDPGAAGLEVLMPGLQVEALADVSIAITGCTVTATVDGRDVQPYRTENLARGETLKIQALPDGLRAYLAVHGGIAVEPILGSRSTYLRGSIGGFLGRALRSGDVIDGLQPGLSQPRVAVEKYQKPWSPGVIRVILGPQAHLFSEIGLERFFTESWRMLPASDRMGFRFEGPCLDFVDASHLPSAYRPPFIVDDFIPMGGIQTPSDGLIIAMGVDGPSLGGFTKIATVFSLDFGALAQTRPGQRVSFTRLAWDDACELSASMQALFGNDVVTRPDS